VTWKGIVNKPFDETSFTDYVNKVVRPAIVKHGWRPRGLVLHNTARPLLSEWPGVVKGKPITPEQRLRNIEAGYIKLGWSGGPHLFVSPTAIHAFTPLWTNGVHSPSFNASYWGLELVGNMDIEAFPPSESLLAVHAIAVLFSALGMVPSVGTMKGGPKGTIFFHRDDPRTTHQGCPGKNVGTKADWVSSITAEMARLHPGDHIDGAAAVAAAIDKTLGDPRPRVHKPGKGVPEPRSA
jgi:hypothetical protein